MIKKITLDKVASYKSAVSIETDKKVNLIYGLNGTGKTTLSNYLYNLNDDCFINCSIEGAEGEELLVYNQRFIQDYFYQSDSLKGIFTLSKENKEAIEKVKNAEKEVSKLEKQKDDKKTEKEKIEITLRDKTSKAENKIWEIKSTYSGGDRVLEYCLSGYMGSKKIFLDKILQIQKPASQPINKIEELKKDIEKIKGDSAQKYTSLPVLTFNEDSIENNLLFQKQIVGNDDIIVAKLIKKLNNADWVQSGLDFLQTDSDKCPFCQQEITPVIIENIKNFFDKEYKNAIKTLKELQIKYTESIMNIPQKVNLENNPFIIENKNEFENLYNSLLDILNTNKIAIQDKISFPSKSIVLQKSLDYVKNLNNFISEINLKIDEHNNKFDHKDETLNEIKSKFWNIMRWDYDQVLSSYLDEQTTATKSIQMIDKDIENIEKNIAIQKDIILTAQKNTINIEESINNINSSLIELGIDDFSIEKYNNELYQIKRIEKCDFLTLSEGEKMMISFLYFCELCKGKKSASSASLKKIVVIDDPISSLSHIWVFNIGGLIKEDFFNSEKYEQVFVLTHSLYFFYELTDIKHERRKENQQLFRIVKNSEGSKIFAMHYEEIQNDYHSYWSIIKDKEQPPALIANCMRNIIDYFFNFVEKKDFNNVFLKAEFKESNKYQAFCRYMNRESHSLGQNIFDLKEFNYDIFKEALKLLFDKSGYSEHYKAMMQ